MSYKYDKIIIDKNLAIADEPKKEELEFLKKSGDDNDF